MISDDDNDYLPEGLADLLKQADDALNTETEMIDKICSDFPASSANKTKAKRSMTSDQASSSSSRLQAMSSVRSIQSLHSMAEDDLSSLYFPVTLRNCNQVGCLAVLEDFLFFQGDTVQGQWGWKEVETIAITTTGSCYEAQASIAITFTTDNEAVTFEFETHNVLEKAKADMEQQRRSATENPRRNTSGGIAANREQPDLSHCRRLPSTSSIWSIQSVRSIQSIHNMAEHDFGGLYFPVSFLNRNQVGCLAVMEDFLFFQGDKEAAQEEWAWHTVDTITAVKAASSGESQPTIVIDFTTGREPLALGFEACGVMDKAKADMERQRKSASEKPRSSRSLGFTDTGEQMNLLAMSSVRSIQSIHRMAEDDFSGLYFPVTLCHQNQVGCLGVLEDFLYFQGNNGKVQGEWVWHEVRTIAVSSTNVSGETKPRILITFRTSEEPVAIRFDTWDAVNKAKAEIEQRRNDAAENPRSSSSEFCTDTGEQLNLSESRRVAAMSSVRCIQSSHSMAEDDFSGLYFPVTNHNHNQVGCLAVMEDFLHFQGDNDTVQGEWAWCEVDTIAAMTTDTSEKAQACIDITFKTGEETVIIEFETHDVLVKAKADMEGRRRIATKPDTTEPDRNLSENPRRNSSEGITTMGEQVNLDVVVQPFASAAAPDALVPPPPPAECAVLVPSPRVVVPKTQQDVQEQKASCTSCWEAFVVPLYHYFKGTTSSESTTPKPDASHTMASSSSAAVPGNPSTTHDAANVFV